MHIFRPGEEGKVFRKILTKPEHVLTMGSIVKHIRNRVDNFPDPIHVVYGDELLLNNDFMSLSQAIRDYAHLAIGTPRAPEEEKLPRWIFNHYRIVQFLGDSEFERLVRSEGNDGVAAFIEEDNYREAVNNIAGFVKKVPLSSLSVNGRAVNNKINVPIVFLRKSLIEDIEHLAQARVHEDSHAFSMGFKEHESLYGYWLGDDGEGETLVRYDVDEWIANIEAREPLRKHSCIPRVYVCGDKKGHERMCKLLDKNLAAIEKARSKIKNQHDLSSLLRVIPVQVMDKTLPAVVSAYESAGGLPKYEPLEK